MEDFALEFVQSDESQESQEPISPEEVLTYEEKQGSHGNDFMSGTSGAIVRTALDETHPIALGLGNTYYSLKSHARVYQLSSEIHNLSYLDSQYKHFGLLGKNLQEKLQSSLVIGVENKGMGKVIYFTDDPLFRGFWDSGERLFYNAIFNF